MPPKKSSPKPRLYATPILASLTSKKRPAPSTQVKAKEPTKKDLADAKRLKKAQEIIEKENLKAGVSFVAGTSPAIPVDPKEKFVKPKPMKGKVSPPVAKTVTDEEIQKAVADAEVATEETESIAGGSDDDDDIEEESPSIEEEETQLIEKTNGHSNGVPIQTQIATTTTSTTTTPTTKEKKRNTPSAPKKLKSNKDEFPAWLPTFFSTVLKEAYSSTDQKVSKKKIQEQAKEESSRTWADPVRKERAQAVADDHVNKMYKSIFG